MSVKKIKIEYLYLDLNTCDRCIGTDQILDGVIEVLKPALDIAGYSLEYVKQEIKNEELAKQYRFVSSPTILVNEKDICDEVYESECGCCSEISGNDIYCRVFRYEGVDYDVPPSAMLAENILKAVFTQTETGCCCGQYELPENLARFFEGKNSKEEKEDCGCGCSCC